MLFDLDNIQISYGKLLLFPACGYRNSASDGALSNVGTNGNCRSSAPKTTATASNGWWDCCVLRLNQTTVDPANAENWKGNAYAVRCVKEK